MTKILVIDDDDRIRDLLKKFLSKENFLVSVASNAIDAENLIKSLKFDLIVVDKMMPEKNGVDFIKTIRQNDDNTPVIMLTAMSDIDSKIEGLSIGADDYISKPFDAKELLLRIINILKRTSAKQTSKNIFYFSNSEYNIEVNEKVIPLKEEQYQRIKNSFFFIVFLLSLPNLSCIYLLSLELEHVMKDLQ